MAKMSRNCKRQALREPFALLRPIADHAPNCIGQMESPTRIVAGHQRPDKFHPVEQGQRIACSRASEQTPPVPAACLGCECDCTKYIRTSAKHPIPTALLMRYMKREMEQGGVINKLYGINFYNNSQPQCECVQPDAEAVLIQLRTLLSPHGPATAAEQQHLMEHVEQLLLLPPERLALVLEQCFLCGMLSAAQLRRLQQLLPMHNALMRFFRRLVSELPHFHYDMSLAEHVELLQLCLMLHDTNARPQARRLLAATMKHMCRLQQTQLMQFLDQLNPAQLQRLCQHLKYSYIRISGRQLQQLLHTTFHVLKLKPGLRLHHCDKQLLFELVSMPAEEPLTIKQRQFLQSLLDHLLPMIKAEQLLWLQDLNLNNTRLRRFHLMLHNPALLCDLQQMKQLYRHLQQLCQYRCIYA
ncbi:uncharacterized protein [Drosophila virilis]|uniref:Uncharacterized protein n=1 Tax=Drosophila virilis TaxID=7244 RepID=B4MEE7_DROVI|nr:uncharacterized protein LOC6636000 [Drosophila virilis]EDW62922.1 uncharacterized protein Dvir_GJ14792 [Drosophila virilis]